MMGAKSVITRSFPVNHIAARNPARAIKMLDVTETQQQKL